MCLCPSFGVQRTDILAGIYTLVRPYEYANLANYVLLQILLYGDKNFPNNLNRSILELTIRFIHSIGRLEQSISPRSPLASQQIFSQLSYVMSV